MTGRLHLAAAALVVVAAGLYAYHDSFGGSFVFDDLNAIEANPTIRRLSWDTLRPPRSAVGGRPVVNLSLAFNYAVGRFDVFSYHVFNLVVHLVVALVLLAVVRRTLLLPALRPRYGDRALPIATAVALLWVVHPLLSESVVYVIQRTELLVSLFMVVALYCLIRADATERPAGWYAGLVGALALGLGSKETMLVAPIVLAAYDRLFLVPSAREMVRRRWGLYATLVIAAAAALIVTGDRLARSLPQLAGSGRIGPWDYARTQCGVVAHYLRLAFWPDRLAADYDGWPIATSLAAVLPSALVVTALVAATLWGVLRGARLAFLGVAFLVVLAPTSSVWPIVSEIAAERRMYLPLAAVVVAVVLAADAVLRRLPRPGVIATVLVLAAASALAERTVIRTADYRSPLVFWTAVVRTRPDNPRARINLGDVHFKQGRTAEARTQYETAVWLRPASPLAHYGLGVTLAAEGRTADAETAYREALRLAPDHHMAHNNLGALLAERGRLAEAVEHYRAALATRPGHARAHYNLGIALLALGRVGEAVASLETAVRLAPDHERARRALEDARRMSGS